MPNSKKYRLIVVPETTAQMVFEILNQTTKYEAAGMLVNPKNGRALTGPEKAAYAQAAGRMKTLLLEARTEEL